MKCWTSLMRNHEALSLGRSYPDNEFTAFSTIFIAVDETFLILCPYFDSPFRYPLRYDLLPQELFKREAPQHRPHPTPPDHFPFSGPQPIRPTSMPLFWETPLGCPISRFGDIVLYLICLLLTAS